MKSWSFLISFFLNSWLHNERDAYAFHVRVSSRIERASDAHFTSKYLRARICRLVRRDSNGILVGSFTFLSFTPVCVIMVQVFRVISQRPSRDSIPRLLLRTRRCWSRVTRENSIARARARYLYSSLRFLTIFHALRCLFAFYTDLLRKVISVEGLLDVATFFFIFVNGERALDAIRSLRFKSDIFFYRSVNVEKKRIRSSDRNPPRKIYRYGLFAISLPVTYFPIENVSC